jgi:hypothetical protein
LDFPKFLDLILVEETRQIYLTREELNCGEIETADAEGRIFMFNLHKEELLLTIAGSKRDKIFKQLDGGADGLRDSAMT